MLAQNAPCKYASNYLKASKFFLTFDRGLILVYGGLREALEDTLECSMNEPFTTVILEAFSSAPNAALEVLLRLTPLQFAIQVKRNKISCVLTLNCQSEVNLSPKK